MVSSKTEDSPDSTPPARPLRSMHTGQNSIAPETSLPQLGQVRWGSVLMDYPSFGRNPEPTSRSIEWCEIVQWHPLANVGPASIASLLLSQGYQIRARIKIR